MFIVGHHDSRHAYNTLWLPFSFYAQSRRWLSPPRIAGETWHAWRSDVPATRQKVGMRNLLAATGKRKKRKLGFQALGRATKRGWWQCRHGRRRRWHGGRPFEKHFELKQMRVQAKPKNDESNQTNPHTHTLAHRAKGRLSLQRPVEPLEFLFTRVRNPSNPSRKQRRCRFPR